MRRKYRRGNPHFRPPPKHGNPAGVESLYREKPPPPLYLSRPLSRETWITWAEIRREESTKYFDKPACPPRVATSHG